MQPLNGQSPDWQILCWATESAQLVWDRKPERRFLPIASQPPTMISPTTGCALWVFVCVRYLPPSQLCLLLRTHAFQPDDRDLAHGIGFSFSALHDFPPRNLTAESGSPRQPFFLMMMSVSPCSFLLQTTHTHTSLSVCFTTQQEVNQTRVRGPYLPFPLFHFGPINQSTTADAADR